MAVRIVWQPAGFTLDALGEHRLAETRAITDGDTPNIRIPIRLLSVDTPETHHQGIAERDWPALVLQLADWIAGGGSPVPDALAAHLLPRLRRADGACAWATHRAQGEAATAAFAELTARRLRRPTGSVRPLFLRVADERFDAHGRLLAYVAPRYGDDELAAMPRAARSTFNLDMVENGHGASFVLFPSIPNETDLPRLQAAARRAVEERRGAWADPLLLTGYELRMVARLIQRMRRAGGAATRAAGEPAGWIERYCIDMAAATIHAPAEYVQVAPWDRIFVWPRDLRRAVGELNLTPAGSIAGA